MRRENDREEMRELGINTLTNPFVPLDRIETQTHTRLSVLCTLYTSDNYNPQKSCLYLSQLLPKSSVPSHCMDLWVLKNVDR